MTDDTLKAERDAYLSCPVALTVKEFTKAKDVHASRSFIEIADSPTPKFNGRWTTPLYVDGWMRDFDNFNYARLEPIRIVLSEKVGEETPMINEMRWHRE